MDKNYNLKTVTMYDRIGYCLGCIYSHFARIFAATVNILRKVEDENFGINLNEREYEALKQADENNIDNIIRTEKNLIKMERHFKKFKMWSSSYKINNNKDIGQLEYNEIMLAEGTINLDEMFDSYEILYEKIKSRRLDRKTKNLALSGIGKICGFSQNIEEIYNFGNANYKTVNKKRREMEIRGIFQ